MWSSNFIESIVCAFENFEKDYDNNLSISAKANTKSNVRTSSLCSSEPCTNPAVNRSSSLVSHI